MAEKEYIERDVALNAIMCEPPDAHYPSWYAGKIEEIPAADVVEIVRCKDCNLRDTEGCPFMAWDCGELMGETNDTDFCSYGERKEQ